MKRLPCKHASYFIVSLVKQKKAIYNHVQVFYYFLCLQSAFLNMFIWVTYNISPYERGRIIQCKIRYLKCKHITLNLCEPPVFVFLETMYFIFMDFLSLSVRFFLKYFFRFLQGTVIDTEKLEILLAQDFNFSFTHKNRCKIKAYISLNPITKVC